MANGNDERLRLQALFEEVVETLDVEVKGWLNLRNDELARATLAKALIALTNHGGGFAILGYEQGPNGMQPAAGRPDNLEGYTTDRVNAAVARYAEPAFHCDIRIVTPADQEVGYPIIIVPASSVPVRSKRNGPNNQGIQENVYYIRRPGPASEMPQTGREWDNLIQRCLRSSGDNLVDRIRDVLAGRGGAEVEPAESELLTIWFNEAEARWTELIDQLPEEHGARMSLGHYATAYVLHAVPARIEGAALLEALRRGVVQLTGWAPFWVPTRAEIRPYLIEGGVECWFGRDTEDPNRPPSRSDFWRATPDGKFFIQRGYQEDSREMPDAEAGSWFDLTLPIWRTGEVMLHAESMARQFDVADGEVTFLFEWTGLAGRRLLGRGDRALWLHDVMTSHQDTYRTDAAVQADQISTVLPELVHQVLAPLYAQFDFFDLSLDLVSLELRGLRGGLRQ